MWVPALMSAAELVGDRDEVDGLAALKQLEHGRVDGPVQVAIEVFRPQRLDDAGDRVAVEQHRAKHTLLGVQVLRGDPFDWPGDAHSWGPPWGFFGPSIPNICSISNSSSPRPPTVVCRTGSLYARGKLWIPF